MNNYYMIDESVKSVVEDIINGDRTSMCYLPYSAFAFGRIDSDYISEKIIKMFKGEIPHTWTIVDNIEKHCIEFRITRC